jgi:hypothetical protein
MNIKNHLQNQIIAKNKAIDECGRISLAASRIASDKMSEIFRADDVAEAMTDFGADEFKQLMADATLAGLQVEIDMLIGSLAQAETGMLIEVKKRYLIVPTGSTLVSPSGFHSSDLVFVRVPGCIEADDLSRVPAGVRFFDMHDAPFQA